MVNNTHQGPRERSRKKIEIEQKKENNTIVNSAVDEILFYETQKVSTERV